MIRKKKEKKMPFIVATYVYASSQGQRKHSARTKIHYMVEIMSTLVLIACRATVEVTADANLGSNLERSKLRRVPVHLPNEI